MAHETVLKMIVNGLQNLAADQQTLAELLNLRALVHGFDETFEGAPYHAPLLPYPDKETSQNQAADLVATIARNSAVFVTYLGGQPLSPEPIPDPLDEAQLLRLIIDWGTVQLGVQKAIVQLYGAQPAPPLGPPNPGASSEQRLWAEIVGWLEKIAADSTSLTEVQQIGTEGEPPGNGVSPLIRMEQKAHETTLNLLGIAGLLPYHLFHAAVPPEPSQSSAMASAVRAERPRPRSPKRKKKAPRRRR